LENATDAEFDSERWVADDREVIDVVFELVEEDFDEEPHPATAMERPTAARSASVLIMVLMMSDRALAFPTIEAPRPVVADGGPFLAVCV
jgi:hypothetical protein